MIHLKFENVTVQYPVYNTRGLSLRNHLVRVSTGGSIEKETGQVQIVTALKNISFSLKEGDSVGLVGHNGAGKTTLLRTMAGVYYPVSGKISRKGRISTLFELGAGMDLDLSGYENIVRMSVLMGITPKDARANIEEIEEFTQLGNFLQLPMRTYSSGMATRLLFAIATSVRPDILLIDEIFQTGDAEFQEKAQQRIHGFINSVEIFVFASHNRQLLKLHCNRFFRLEHGSVTEINKSDIQE
jgi:ABC-type polysaccharide/polyol phosphate transport system ATPase subunit